MAKTIDLKAEYDAATMRGRTFTFLSPGGLFYRKSLSPQKFGDSRGQTCKGQKVKVFIYNKL